MVAYSQWQPAPGLRFQVMFLNDDLHKMTIRTYLAISLIMNEHLLKFTTNNKSLLLVLSVNTVKKCVLVIYQEYIYLFINSFIYIYICLFVYMICMLCSVLMLLRCNGDVCNAGRESDRMPRLSTNIGI